MALLQIASIKGSSMTPTFQEGDLLLFRPPWWVRPGQVLLIQRSSRAGVDIPQVKRLIRIEHHAYQSMRPTTGYWVEGDAKAASTDSRNFGPLRRDEIKGVLLFRIGRRR
jgi:signal peptidase I